MKLLRAALPALLASACTVNVAPVTAINASVQGEVNAPIAMVASAPAAPASTTPAPEPTLTATPTPTPRPKTNQELTAECMEAGFGETRREMEAVREADLATARRDAPKLGYTEEKLASRLAEINKAWDFHILRASNAYLYNHCAR